MNIKEIRNVLYSEALNTFYSRLYGVKHMVKEHLDSEIENPLPTLHGLLFPSSNNGYFIRIIPRPETTYHSLCDIAETRISSTSSP